MREVLLHLAGLSLLRACAAPPDGRATALSFIGDGDTIR